MTPVASSSKPESSHRWPAFDGIRAISVLAVITFHSDYPSFVKGGYLGVDVFFVLSGFLITWLLVSEHDAYSGISYRKFYARRALRLFPALAVVIVTAVLLVTLDGGLASVRHLTLVGVPFVVLYSGNWAIAVTSVATLGLLSITWSLAVEEQYYILWPFVLRRLLPRMDRRRLAAVLAGIALTEQVVRSLLVLSNSISLGTFLDKATVTHTDGILLGSALALFWSSGAQWRLRVFVERQAVWLSTVGAGVLVLAIFVGTPTLRTTSLWVSLAVYASAALLVGVVAQPSNAVSRLLSWGPLVWLGQRAYGIYLWHVLVIFVVATLHLPQRHVHFVRFVIDVVASVVIAGVSYRIVEQPFLRRKDRFARVKATPGGSQLSLEGA